MSQVAVVIGGGQTLGEFLCHGLVAEGYRVAVVDIQSEKAARVADAINTESAGLQRGDCESGLYQRFRTGGF